MAKKASFEEKEFEKCWDVFERMIYPDNEMDGLMCKLHGALGHKGKDHNCLGCNFDTSTHHIYMFLGQDDGHEDLELSATTYILLMYLVAERVETIFEIIGLPEQYKNKHFRTLTTIKKWANFIKHPKAFILCHHPDYQLENYPGITAVRKSAKVIIDNAFVHKYYSGDHNNKELFQLIANKKSVLVLFPDLGKLTTDFCNCLIKFVQVIEQNEVFKEILNDKATIENFFTEDTSNSDK